MKTVKILGTDYKVIFKDYKDDPLFEKRSMEDRGWFCVLLIDIHEEFCIELFLTIGFFYSTLLLEEDDLIVTDLSVTGFDPLSEYLPSSFIFPSIRGRFSD